MKKRTKLNLFLSTLKTLFFSGLVAILPLALTYAILLFLIRFVYSLLKPLQYIEPHLFRKMPYSEFIFAFLVIILFGAILQLFALRRLVDWFEKLAEKIPFFGSLYSGTRQLVQAFGSQKGGKGSFQQVVLVQFTRPNMYFIGFVTGTLSDEFAPEKGKAYYRVFIPTTPNPAHGYFVIAEEKDCIATNLTRQDAMALIISGGIITPETVVRKP